jgi:hypothetical protein
MTKDEALKLALGALEGVVKNCWRDIPSWRLDEIKERITAIKQALAQPAPVQEPVGEKEISAWAERHDIQGTPTDLRSMFEDAASFTTPPAQPAVPDVIHHTDLSEHPQYIEGWNDCRAEMLKGMKP